MADAHVILADLVPVILLLTLGVVAAVASRAVGLRPIVGYIVLGLALSGIGLDLVADSTMISTLAELGVVFLLFDIGLHFSLAYIREQARDIFGFGPVQVVAGTVALGFFGLLFGLPSVAAFVVGATLALSSTAVVAGLIAERHQQNCPVGLTATAHPDLPGCRRDLSPHRGFSARHRRSPGPGHWFCPPEGGRCLRRRGAARAPRGPAPVRLDPDHVGAASAFNSAVARIAGLVATALLGFVFAQQGSADAFIASFRFAVLVGAASAALAAGCAILFLRPLAYADA